MSVFIQNFLFSQNTEWVVSMGGTRADKGISIGTDSLGYIYVSGYFNTSATFGSFTLTNSSPSGNNKEAFVLKMDSAGTVLWALRGGNGNGSCCDDRALGMHVTPGGFVYLTGTFWSTFDIGSCYISYGQANSHDSSLLTKIDPDGNCVWARSFGADAGSGSGPSCPYPIWNADDHSYDVKVDKEGNIFVTGFFSGVSAVFDAFTLTNPNWGTVCYPLGYVGKLDSNGNFLWAHKFDGIEDQKGSRDNRLAIDNFSNVYVTGGFQNTGVFGPFSINSKGLFDVFLFKIDTDGNWKWVRSVGTNKDDRGNGIAIDYCDNIYIAGEYKNPMIFPGANASNGSDTLSHSKKRDIFVAKITTNGDWVWAKRARSKGVDKAYQMSVDENMQVFVCGSAGDSLRFNSSIELSIGDTSISAFVAQLDGSGVGDWVWAKMGGGPSDDDRIGDICDDGKGNLYGAGFFKATAIFDGVSVTSVGKGDVVVWKLKKDENVAVTPSNCIYVDVQPPGSGTISLTGTGTILTHLVNVSQYPSLQSLSDSVNQTFNATPITGYEFVNWDWGNHAPYPNSTTANSFVFTTQSDTVIAYFQVIPVDTIVYVVQPPGSGSISVDGTNIFTFPSTNVYNENTTSTLTATPNAGFFFDNWDFAHNTAMPNATNSNITVTWASNDTCFVNFTSIPNYDITYLTEPAGAGSIDIYAVNYSTLPLTQTYQQGTNVTIEAIDEPNFIFSHWSKKVNTLNPSVNDNLVNFNVAGKDTIIAHYNEIDTLWVIMKPAGVAHLKVESDYITTTPFMGLYKRGSLINIEALPYATNVFDQWNLNNNNLPDYNPSTLFTFIDNDTLYAYFNNALAIENLGEDIGELKIYPNVVNHFITFEVLAKENTFAQIDLLNISGQKTQNLYQGNLTQGVLQKEVFNIKGANGVYFIRIQTDKTNTIFKIIKI